MKYVEGSKGVRRDKVDGDRTRKCVESRSVLATRQVRAIRPIRDQTKVSEWHSL